MRILIVLFASLFLLSGCAGNRIDYNKQSINLSLGMNKAGVQSVLGSPRRTDVSQDRERWIYWSPSVIGLTPVDNEQLAQDRLVVTFESGKVTRWGNQTFADDIMDASQKTIESSYRLMQQPQPPTE